MSGIKQPVTQVRLTNVAVVRYKTKGHRYEIACYKNKVVSWRQGVEQDIDEVLQSRHIFSNVSKGVLAGDELLMADFGTREEQHIAKVILDKGEIQVSEKERAAALDALFRDISVLVADLCVNPDTRRPYPVRMIEQGMRDAHYSIKQHKSAKSQALAVIKLLQQHMPLDRAHMRVVITCEIGAGKDMKRRLQPLIAAVEEEEWGSAEYRVKVLLSPGNYRQVEELIAQQNKGRAHCEILDLKVADDAILDEDNNDGDDADGHSDDDDDEQQPQPLPVIHKPAPRTAATTGISSQLAATHLSQAQPQPQSTAAAHQRSKKAMRKVLDEEEIRTVGERREWEEEIGDVEDSSEVRQRQQQAARKAKKERKNKNKATKDDEDDEAGSKAKSKGKKAVQDGDSEEGEEEGENVAHVGKNAVGALDAVGEDDEDEDGAARPKKEKKSRRKKKAGVVASVTSLHPRSENDDDD